MLYCHFCAVTGIESYARIHTLVELASLLVKTPKDILHSSIVTSLFVFDLTVFSFVLLKAPRDSLMIHHKLSLSAVICDS